MTWSYELLAGPVVDADSGLSAAGCCDHEGPARIKTPATAINQ